MVNPRNRRRRSLARDANLGNRGPVVHEDLAYKGELTNFMRQELDGINLLVRNLARRIEKRSRMSSKEKYWSHAVPMALRLVLARFDSVSATRCCTSYLDDMYNREEHR